MLSKKRILKKLQQLTRCAKTMLGERERMCVVREREDERARDVERKRRVSKRD